MVLISCSQQLNVQIFTKHRCFVSPFDLLFRPSNLDYLHFHPPSPKVPRTMSMATVRSAAALAVLILGHSVPAVLGQTCAGDQATALCIKDQFEANGGNGQLSCNAQDLSVSYRMGVVDMSRFLFNALRSDPYALSVLMMKWCDHMPQIRNWEILPSIKIYPCLFLV